MNEQLIIAYDGSEGAASAVAAAGRLTTARRALIVHVYVALSSVLLRSSAPVPGGPLAEALEEFDSADVEDAQGLAAEGARLATEAGLEAQPMILEREGKTWQTIAAAAREQEVTAIVAGARGRSALASALLGSTSQGLAVHSPVPVLVVPSDGGPSMTAANVLVAYDGSPGSDLAIAAAARLFGDSELIVLSVGRSLAAAAAAGVIGVPAGVAGDALARLDEAAQAACDGLAEKGAQAAGEHGAEARAAGVLSEASVWRTILSTAEENDAEAIVVGSRGRSGVQSMVLGSVSHAVLHHAARPVLVVPRGPLA